MPMTPTKNCTTTTYTPTFRWLWCYFHRLNSTRNCNRWSCWCLIRLVQIVSHFVLQRPTTKKYSHLPLTLARIMSPTIVTMHHRTRCYRCLNSQRSLRSRSFLKALRYTSKSHLSLGSTLSPLLFPFLTLSALNFLDDLYLVDKHNKDSLPLRSK